VTVLEVIQRSTEFLQGRGVDSPRLQVELMLAHVLKVPRLRLYLNFDRQLTEGEVGQLRDMVKRRGQREPLQHILGSTSFCGIEIQCTREALIPRPETELLAERGWQFLAAIPNARALEIGTGTGCIAIALVMNALAAHVVTVDVSAEALALARENAQRLGVADRITFVQGDALGAVPTGAPFHLLISNPPYVAAAEIDSLQVEVRDFDPRLALDGGADGLNFYRQLARDGARFLTSGGRLMVEFGDGQETELQNLFSAEKWVVEEIVADYSARPRILVARRGD
jgi:release factor glutamine methyltransferase